MSDSVRPHRQQPTRLPCPWDSPGKNTGVGCHFFLQCTKVKSESEVAQLCPTFSDPMDCSLPGSSIHGIFQARVREWGAIALGTKKICSFLHVELDEMAAKRSSWAPIRSCGNSEICCSWAPCRQPTTTHCLRNLDSSHDPTLGMNKAKYLQARWVLAVAWDAQRPSTC